MVEFNMVSAVNSLATNTELDVINYQRALPDKVIQVKRGIYSAVVRISIIVNLI